MAVQSDRQPVKLPSTLSEPPRAESESSIEVTAKKKGRIANMSLPTLSSSNGDTHRKSACQPSVRELLKNKAYTERGLDARSSLSGRIQAFRENFDFIKKLTPQQVDDFMDSYVIYNLDWADEQTMIATLGPDYTERVGKCLMAWYVVVNHMCAMGEVEKMYIPPIIDKRGSVLENQLLYERVLARALHMGSLGPSGTAELSMSPAGTETPNGQSPASLGRRSPPTRQRFLELGCGRGRVAAHLSTVTGANVTGLNIDPTQLESAWRFSREHHLPGNRFMKHDFNVLPLPFPSEAFDGCYEIQAISLSKDLFALYKEVYRVLKPGAHVSLLEWVSLPAYNPLDPQHADLMARVKPLVGAVGTPTPQQLEAMLRSAGFVLEKSENASTGADGFQYPLIGHVDRYFQSLRKILNVAVKARLLPRHIKMLMDRFTNNGDAFVEMDKLRLMTTAWWVVAKKPALDEVREEKEKVAKKQEEEEEVAKKEEAVDLKDEPRADKTNGEGAPDPSNVVVKGTNDAELTRDEKKNETAPVEGEKGRNGAEAEEGVRGTTAEV